MIDALRNALAYDPETGALIWRERADQHQRWNTRYARKPAGKTHHSGYISIKFRGRWLQAHRVAWAITYGTWPDGHIDHINGRPGDNRIANLRVVSDRENARNQGVSRNNTSGRTGVFWSARTARWRATIKVQYRSIYLGDFTDFSMAVAARKSAEAKYGFHENHGKRSAVVRSALTAGAPDEH